MAESGINCAANKVYSELNGKLGLCDNEFAGFVANLGRNCGTLEEFGNRLKELGIDIPNYVIYSLFTKIYEDVGVSRSDLEIAIRMSIEDHVIRERRRSLPIYSVKDDLMKAVNENRVLVVSGGVGCGKTSQITQYLVDSGYASNGRLIACTGPHPEFVEFVAVRVAEEYGCELGQEVGYATTLDDKTSESTLIKYMSVDVLLWEFMEDPKLSKYSVIVIDEADARSAFTDLLVSILNHFVLRANHDLRLVVVTCPLVDCYPHKFTGFLFNSHVFTIPTTTYPVGIVYTVEQPVYWPLAAVDAIVRIIKEGTPGDILAFWCCDFDIVCLADCIQDENLTDITRDLVIVPVLDPSAFEPAPPGKRKLVIASDEFSEACMSIDGIRYVLDPGVASPGEFDPSRCVYMTHNQPISQESAMKRARLAGRVEKGKCFRLYTREFYRDEMPRTCPEIQRLDLCSIVLYMKAVGIHDVFSFKLMDPPPSEALSCATRRLHALGALDDERGHLTQSGSKMAAFFPLDPPLCKMLMAGVDLGCSDEMLTIISMIETYAADYPPGGQTEEWGQRSRFEQEESELLTMHAIYEDGKAHNFSEEWCQESLICPAKIRRAHVGKNKLVRMLKDKWGVEVVSSGGEGIGSSEKMRRAIASGLFLNAAKKEDSERVWKLVDKRHPRYSPSRGIQVGSYGGGDQWVVALSVSDCGLDGITLVDPHWLPST